ncbi:MAG: DUF2202 domain-containing protein [Cellulomonas sp.]
MRTTTRVATVIASGVIATALLASPSLASGQRGGLSSDQATPNPQSTQVAGTCDGTGTGPGAPAGARSGNRAGTAGQRGGGQGTARQGGGGAMMGTGVNADLTDVASGSLTDAQRSALAAIAEEEKVAHDLYVAFADSYSARSFDRIATAETQHLTEVRIVLDRYDITDPTAGLAVGTFTSAGFQELYDTQLAAGSVDLTAAYGVGVLIEETDIADLAAAASDLAAPDVAQVYANLLAGSERHLGAFGG